MMSAQMSPTPDQPAETVDWTKFAVRMTILSAMFPILLFLSAGQWDWGMGWVYVVLVVSITVISRYLMFRRNPGLLEERTEALSREDTKRWDKILAPLVAMSPLVQIIVAGLDFRNDWSPTFATWVEWLGIALLLVGYLFAGWVMLTNAFYSSTVRIQTDREQRVITEGPYRFVRHPSYLGFLIGSIGTSLILSSAWSLVVVALFGVVLVIRTSLEDAALQDELPGYREFTQKTRYRLFPGLW
jgi:protein-S-isoprenylcysteine O-methyltransferase Ste14